MARYLPAGVGLLLIVISALVQGNWSVRWGKFPDLELYAEQLPNVPIDIGNWRGTPREEPSKKTLDLAGAVGSLSREYTNDEGQHISLFVVTGRLGDLFYHNPTRCYGAAGFEQKEKRAEIREIPVGDGETADFFAAQFVKSEATTLEDQMVYWSWCGSGKWLAPKEPKWDFRGQHALYKIYLIYTPTRADDADHNPANEFVPVLIPELNRAFEKAYLEAEPLTEDT